MTISNTSNFYNTDIGMYFLNLAYVIKIISKDNEGQFIYLLKFYAHKTRALNWTLKSVPIFFSSLKKYISENGSFDTGNHRWSCGS